MLKSFCLATEKRKRRGGLFAQHNCRGRRPRRPEKQTITATKGKRFVNRPYKKKPKISRRGGVFAQHNCRGRRPRRPEKQTITATKTADTSSVLPYGNPPSPAGEGLRRMRPLAARRFVRATHHCRDRASTVAEQQDGPKRNEHRNRNGGRRHIKLR